jgi:hypothetical protein
VGGRSRDLALPDEVETLDERKSNYREEHGSTDRELL